MTEREKEIEAYLVSSIRKAGGLAWKFTSPGTRGVPDRWCVLNGQQFFVEVKRPDARKRKNEKLQEHRARQLTEQGCAVYRIGTKKAVDLLIKWLQIGHLPKPERLNTI